MNQNDLISKITQAANHINSANIRGSANYIVTSSFFAEALCEIERKEKFEKRKRIIDKILKSGS